MNDKTKRPLNDLKDPDCFSFLLRLWRIDEPRCLEWRASLESPEMGQRLGFASLEQLFGYLMNLCECKEQVRESEEKECNQAFSMVTDQHKLNPAKS